MAARPLLRSIASRAALALLLALAGPLSSTAQGTAGDAAAKAKFVVTFSRFVQWPAASFAGAEAPLRLCLQHASPAIGEAFAAQQGAQVGARHLLVVGNPSADAGLCHLMFVDASAPRMVPRPAGEPVLTLGTVDGFIGRGGMVEIVNVDDSLRFDVNLKTLRAAQLGVSSQVLRLARQVRE